MQHTETYTLTDPNLILHEFISYITMLIMLTIWIWSYINTSWTLTDR